MQRFYRKKLNDAEVRVKISNRFAALENFDDNVDINRAWENIRGNISTSVKASLGHYKLKQHKPQFGKGQTMQVRMITDRVWEL
jgi:hypothetical protein